MIAVYVFGGILLILIGAVLVGSVVEKEPTDAGTMELDPKERQAAALEALREIEFEYQTGKLLEEDYVLLRNRYATRALEARDAIDEPPAPGPGSCHACGEAIEGRVRFCPRCGAAQAAAASSDDAKPEGDS